MDTRTIGFDGYLDYSQIKNNYNLDYTSKLELCKELCSKLNEKYDLVCDCKRPPVKLSDGTMSTHIGSYGIVMEFKWDK